MASIIKETPLYFAKDGVLKTSTGESVKGFTFDSITDLRTMHGSFGETLLVEIDNEFVISAGSVSGTSAAKFAVFLRILQDSGKTKGTVKARTEKIPYKQGKKEVTKDVCVAAFYAAEKGTEEEKAAYTNEIKGAWFKTAEGREDYVNEVITEFKQKLQMADPDTGEIPFE